MTRYDRVFEQLRVVARVKPVDTVTPGWLHADGDRVSFAPVPYFVGPWQYLMNRGKVRAALRAAVGEHDAVIFRAPSTLANDLQRDFVKAARSEHKYQKARIRSR